WQSIWSRFSSSLWMRNEAGSLVLKLAALKQQIQLFIKAAELSKEAKKKVTPYSERAEITTLIKSIATLKKTWMPLYEQVKSEC
uniref:hypothetical protein n=1 Tax=Mediterraneibacter agrestimuris TaxID=2941333 RepID=UPI00203BBECA